MAWTTPRTWVDNEDVTASLMNTHVRDNLKYLYDPGAWTSYTPVLANFSTSTYTATGYYQYVNQSTIVCRISVTVNTFTGTGTTGVTVTLPVNVRTTGMTSGLSPIGTAIYRPNGGASQLGAATYSATGTFSVLLNSATAPNTARWTLNAPASQAPNDVWVFHLTYEVA